MIDNYKKDIWYYMEIYDQKWLIKFDKIIGGAIFASKMFDLLGNRFAEKGCWGRLNFIKFGRLATKEEVFLHYPFEVFKIDELYYEIY